MEWLKSGIIRHPYESPTVDLTIGLMLKMKKSEIDELKVRMLALNHDRDVSFLTMQGFMYDTDGNFYYHPNCNNIYIYNNANSTKTYVKVLFHLMGKAQEFNEFWRWYSTRTSLMHDLLAEQQRISSIEDNIRNKMTLLKGYEPFSIDNVIKEAKKMKIKAVFDGRLIHFDLGKIKCGDEEDGYINYQNIIISLTADNDLALSDIHYKFAKWEYKYSWKFCAFDLHPHVSGSSLCTGNRKQDFMQYRIHKEYGFLLSAYREALTCYNPGSAYIKVPEIAKILNGIGYYYNNPAIDEKATDGEKAKAIYNLMVSQKKRCSECGNVYYGDECDTADCIKNPDTKKLCSGCDKEMIWNSAIHRIMCPTCYTCPQCGNVSKESYCANSRCTKSPLYAEPCGLCFGMVRVVDGEAHCDNPLCRDHKDYTTEGKELIAKPVCLICNGVHSMQQNSGGEWYCNTHGHSQSQYTRYGAPMLSTASYISLMRSLKNRILEERLYDGNSDYMRSMREPDGSYKMYGRISRDSAIDLVCTATPFQYTNEYYGINEIFYKITWRQEYEQQISI